MELTSQKIYKNSTLSNSASPQTKISGVEFGTSRGLINKQIIPLTSELASAITKVNSLVENKAIKDFIGV